MALDMLIEYLALALFCTVGVAVMEFLYIQLLIMLRLKLKMHNHMLPLTALSSSIHIIEEELKLYIALQ